MRVALHLLKHLDSVYSGHYQINQCDIILDMMVRL